MEGGRRLPGRLGKPRGDSVSRQVPWRCRGCVTLPLAPGREAEARRRPAGPGQTAVSWHGGTSAAVWSCCVSVAKLLQLCSSPSRRTGRGPLHPAPCLHGYGAPSCLTHQLRQKEVTSSAVDTVENPKLHAECLHLHLHCCVCFRHLCPKLLFYLDKNGCSMWTLPLVNQK